MDELRGRGPDATDSLDLLHAAARHRLKADLDRNQSLEPTGPPVAGVDHVVVKIDVEPVEAPRLPARSGPLDELRLERLALPVEVATASRSASRACWIGRTAITTPTTATTATTAITTNNSR